MWEKLKLKKDIAVKYYSMGLGIPGASIPIPIPKSTSAMIDALWPEDKIVLGYKELSAVLGWSEQKVRRFKDLKAMAIKDQGYHFTIDIIKAWLQVD